MHHFTYREDELFCENVPVQKIAAEIGTPFYLYSHATLTRHFNAFSEAFEDMKKLICFSAKANTNLAVLKLFATAGCGLDIVSGGELFRGIQAGFTTDRIVYSGVGKRVDEIDYALKSEIDQPAGRSAQPASPHCHPGQSGCRSQNPSLYFYRPYEKQIRN
jgi:diaminopimelate decarboxylase